jgi:hypothetical protein
MSAAQTRRDKFTEVYQKNIWNGTASLSGTGSDRQQTALLRQILPAVLSELGVKSLVDAPCGDLHWMKHVPWESLGITYTGVDIVAPLVDSLRTEYPARRFECLDLVTDILPCADLILCRDCLVHLPLAEIQLVIKQFIKSGATWMLTTTFPNSQDNADVRWSGWRPLNLELPPLALPKPARLVVEGCTENGGKYADKSLGLWRLSDLA